MVPPSAGLSTSSFSPILESLDLALSKHLQLAAGIQNAAQYRLSDPFQLCSEVYSRSRKASSTHIVVHRCLLCMLLLSKSLAAFISVTLRLLLPARVISASLRVACSFNLLKIAVESIGRSSLSTVATCPVDLVLLGITESNRSDV